jgi:predicted TIM-barrel fold metal-dependent hydrolase
MRDSRALNRRQLLAGTAASLAFAETAARCVAAGSQSTPGEWIDAHAHLWTTDLQKYPLRNQQPVEVLAPRSFTPEELDALAVPEGVGRVVLIQHHPYHGFDNSYLIDVWKSAPDKYRIVGQIDDTQPDPDVLMKQMQSQGVTGFRIGPREDRPEWLAGDGIALMWKTAAETRQNMCCLINPGNLPETDRWCAKFPDTPVVIDHFARIGGDGTIHEPDLANLCRLAKHPLVKVKLSAYYAFGAKRPPHSELVPMIKRLYETFGPDRLMWASDSPYQVQSPNTYADSIALIRDRIDFLTAADRCKLLRTTAETTFFA